MIQNLELHVINQAMFPAMWPQMRPLIDKCISRAYHGEMETDDVFSLAIDAKVFAIAGFIASEMVVVGVFQPIEYPQMNCLNCIVVAGKSPGVMARINADWMGKLREYARNHLGMDAIECLASEAMTKVLVRMGYRKTYNFLRMGLN